MHARSLVVNRAKLGDLPELLCLLEASVGLVVLLGGGGRLLLMLGQRKAHASAQLLLLLLYIVDNLSLNVIVFSRAFLRLLVHVEFFIIVVDLVLLRQRRAQLGRAAALKDLHGVSTLVSRVNQVSLLRNQAAHVALNFLRIRF